MRAMRVLTIGSPLRGVRVSVVRPGPPPPRVRVLRGIGMLARRVRARPPVGMLLWRRAMRNAMLRRKGRY